MQSQAVRSEFNHSDAIIMASLLGDIIFPGLIECTPIRLFVQRNTGPILSAIKSGHVRIVQELLSHTKLFSEIVVALLAQSLHQNHPEIYESTSKSVVISLWVQGYHMGMKRNPIMHHHLLCSLLSDASKLHEMEKIACQSQLLHVHKALTLVRVF